MDIKKKSILAILLLLAVLGYTAWNYASGNTDLMMFLVCTAILGIPLVNMVNILIREWKEK